MDAANLVTDAMWKRFFASAGNRLESLELSWLDSTMDDEMVAHLVEGCPNLKQLSMKKCFRMGEESLRRFTRLEKLERLSLTWTKPASTSALVALVSQTGSNLRELSLRRFHDVDDDLLQAIHLHCSRLTKLSITDNDSCTDGGFATLFLNWTNPPLVSLNLSADRDISSSEPEIPEERPGLASSGFKALMSHSGSAIERLDIKSCRHITHDALCDVFDGIKTYPHLKDVNLSFVSQVDAFILSGLFKSCPSVQKVAVFGCFGLNDVLVPPGVALIGRPIAHESIVQEGE